MTKIKLNSREISDLVSYFVGEIPNLGALTSGGNMAQTALGYQELKQRIFAGFYEENLARADAAWRLQKWLGGKLARVRYITVIDSEDYIVGDRIVCFGNRVARDELKRIMTRRFVVDSDLADTIITEALSHSSRHVVAEHPQFGLTCETRRVRAALSSFVNDVIVADSMVTD